MTRRCERRCKWKRRKERGQGDAKGKISIGGIPIDGKAKGSKSTSSSKDKDGKKELARIKDEEKNNRLKKDQELA